MNLVITGSDNGLSPVCQVIIWTNADILSVEPKEYIDDLVQDCSYPIADALELLQYCAMA